MKQAAQREIRDARAAEPERGDDAARADSVSRVTGAVTSRRTGLRHPFVRASMWSLAILLLLEGLVRWKGDAFIASGEDAEFRRRFAWLSAQPRASLMVLGDSLAQRGLSPAALASAGIPGGLNAGVSAGSGIVAAALARAVTWRPDRVVFASNPAEVLDSCDLNRHEENLVSLTDPRAWPFLNGGLVVGRASQLFRRRAGLQSAFKRAVHERRLYPAQGFLWNESMHEQPDGFLAIRPAHMPDSAERALWANTYVPQWFQHRERNTGLRLDSLVDAMRAWSGPQTQRTLVIMPQSSEYRAAIPAHESPARILAAWRTAADRSDSALIDCSAALPDGDFADADHLEATAAARFSTTLAHWLQGGDLPAGCTLIRPRS